MPTEDISPSRADSAAFPAAGVPARYSATRPVTLAAVAAAAGVSISTASLVFSGAGPVAAATRDRVLAAAVDLDFAGPDPRGRSLRRGRSGIVAVVLEESVRYAFRDPVKIAYLDGIAAEVAAAGLALLLVPDAADGPATLETVAADAAILIGCSPNVAHTVQQGRRRNLPMIAMGSTDFADVPAITLNDRAATAELAALLRRLGHRDVAMVTLPMDASHRRGTLTAEWECSATVPQALERLHGARDVFPGLRAEVAEGSLVEEGRIAGTVLLGVAGPGETGRQAAHPDAARFIEEAHSIQDRDAAYLLTSRQWAAPSPVSRQEAVDSAISRDFEPAHSPAFEPAHSPASPDFEAAHPSASHRNGPARSPASHRNGPARSPASHRDGPANAPAGRRPTGIIAQSDLLAAGVILAAEDLGLAVPQDVSVVGFDGIRTDTIVPHDLTTAVQPAVEQGHAAARMALEMIDGALPGSQLFRTKIHLGATAASRPA